MVAVLLSIVVGASAGDLLLTRNANSNETWGFWNHVGLCVGDSVIEAQDGYGVIITPLANFVARYPTVAVMRPIGASPCDIERACAVARGFVGTPYQKVTPIFRLFGLRPGNSCVSLVRKAHALGYGVDPGWVFPDHIYRDGRYVLAEAKGAVP